MRRVLLRAWVGLPQSVPPEPQYVRVLAIGRQGRGLLRRMKDTCALPVIIKPVTERGLPENLQSALARDALADDLYTLAYPRARPARRRRALPQNAVLPDGRLISRRFPGGKFFTQTTRPVVVVLL